MDISIFGMGYVGAVCAACLAEDGHRVLGVDVSSQKVRLIREGRSPIVEPGLAALLEKGVRGGRLSATADAAQAVRDTQLSMICVGTPSRKSGDLDLSYVRAVARQIGAALRDKPGRHSVVIRSTVLPGTVRGVVLPILESTSGKKAGEHFGLAVNPEFLRESSAIRDFRQPPMTVIGEWDEASGAELASLYAHLPAPVLRQPLEVAEMVKYACNVWHATKISFANEIGNVAKAAGVDGRVVMEVVCQDSKLNLSDYYLRPGFAFGGSCLPKDVRALSYRATQLDVDIPLLKSLMHTNQLQIRKAFELIESFGLRKVGLLGLSFKAKTDDLRESPLVELAEMLIGKGYELAIFDQNVEYARVNGANREYINRKIPHVSALLKSDLREVLDASQVLVLGQRDGRFEPFVNGARADHKIVDLVGFMPESSGEDMQGICW